MAYSDWDSEFRDLFEGTPGTDALENWEQGHVEALFQAGFTHHAEDYEALGLSEDAVEAIRQEFFDYMGLDDYEFDWEGWREAMGYE
jgi:hypothetical protein